MVDVVERLHRWFGNVDVRGSDRVLAGPFLAELVDMLDSLLPTMVDTAASSVWQGADGDLRVSIVHSVAAGCVLRVDLGRDEGVIGWSSYHEPIGPGDGWDDRPWPVVLLDCAGAVLCGEYAVDHVFRGRTLTRALLIDISDPSDEQRLGEVGWLSALLPWPSRRIEREVVDFGGSRPDERDGESYS